MDRLRLFPNQLLDFDTDECVALSWCDVWGNIQNAPMYHGFTYAATQFLEGVTPNTGGTDPWTGGQSIIAYGALPVNLATSVAKVASELYEANWANWSAGDKQAALTFYANGIINIGLDYDKMIAYMQKTGFGCVVPLTWFSSFLEAPGGQLPPPSGVPSNHCVAVYLHADGVTPLMKPWTGESWGNGGYAVFSRELFNTIAVDVYAFNMSAIRWYSLLAILITKYPFLAEFTSQLLTIDGNMPTQTANGQKLYATAASFLDKQVAPLNEIDQYGVLGCAITLNILAEKAWGAQIGGGYSTAALWECLKTSKFESVTVANALPGDIIISPTGSNANARLAHGHVGIVAKYGILSNNSETGTLEETFDMGSWQAYYTTYGGLPTLVYRAV